MASFGRLTISSVTGTNENTLALANINFDFSLLRITPPKEFLDFGESLSTFRKQEAEEGTFHQTARKLGAIFEPILPATPRLLRSYGTRASEIALSTASSVPKEGGMFKKQLGIDGTSIWAAATSGSGALQVHLLACMLARIWEQKDAISIWEELLEHRRSEIKDMLQVDGSMSMAAYSSYNASLQTITRTQIGEWDDSARSWLRIADRSRTVVVRQNQLDQIVSKTRNSVNNRPCLYDSVIQAWKMALEGTERLLDGSPQQMQSGELLLGLNAWHIYPDINLLGDPDVFSDFDDPLVPKPGILTIGLVRSADTALTEGLHWSLPLAHLRYYGDPISRTAILSGVQNRISLPEFMQTILGSLLGSWRVDHASTENVLQWILLLYDGLKRGTTHRPDFSVSNAKGNWMELLAQASRAFLEAEGDQKLLFKRLVQAGRSYGSKRLIGMHHDLPYFGMSQTLNVFYLIKDQEKKIEFLRELVKSASKYTDDLIIRYVSETTGQEEFASVYSSSYLRAFEKKHDGPVQARKGYRWISRSPKRVGTADQDHCVPNARTDVFMGNEVFETHRNTEDVGSLNESLPGPPAREQPKPSLPETTDYEGRARYLESLGEVVCSIEEEPLRTVERSGGTRIIWGDIEQLSDYNQYDEWYWDPPYGEVKHFALLFGDPHDVALFLRMSKAGPAIPDMVRFESLADLFRNDNVELDMLPYIFFDAVQSSTEGFSESLRAIATIHQIYEPLPGATLAIKLLELDYPLYDAYWVQFNMLDVSLQEKSTLGDILRESNFKRSRRSLRKSIQADRISPLKVSLAETFCCILLCDSGVYNIAPSHMRDIMAISSGASLFIADFLLVDPVKSRHRSNKIRHVMGNIGRAGTALLQAPDNPKIRKIGVEQWMHISGEDWDGQRRDAFRDTSLHLWFTGSTLPIEGKHTVLGEKDTGLFMLESVISIHGRGTNGFGEVGIHFRIRLRILANICC